MKHQVPFRLRWLLLIVALLALIAVVTLARHDEFGPRAAFANLQVRAGGKLDAHWNEQTGVPDFISGKDPSIGLPYTPSVIERGNPSAIARGFLDENRALFKLTSASEQL